MRITKQNWRQFFLLKNINAVIRFLTLSDVVMMTGFGLVGPIFAVFITDHIVGGSLEVAGIATAIYLLTKSIGQVPVAAVIDKIRGEKDDFWVMFFSSLVISVVPLLYLTIETPVQLYLVQLLYGLAAAAVFPSWMAIFTRHIDATHEGVEWGIYQTLVDVGGAMAGALGGFLATRFGFDNLFILISIFLFVGSFLLLGARSRMRRARS